MHEPLKTIKQTSDHHKGLKTKIIHNYLLFTVTAPNVLKTLTFDRTAV